MLLLLPLLLYFLLLLLVSYSLGRSGNEAFFRAGRQSPWPVVAFGMVGASISGLTFIGVPGWVMTTDMTYLQMCLGFIVGYILVAFVLLPVYYRLGLTSIYTYLFHRFGFVSYRTGTWFFIVSKLLGASAKFYAVIEILQTCIADAFGIPYGLTALVTLLLIWLYTRRGGIRALVWTDALQTLVLLLALVLILLRVCSVLQLDVSEALIAVWNDPHSRIFEWDDWTSRQHFLKQFLSGIFIVVVMTGLDQDMMQKNLTCRNLRSAQLNMCSYGLLFLPVNFLFLSLGVLLLMLYAQTGLSLPASGDVLLSTAASSGVLGQLSLTLFVVGVVASAFSSADSALTALTTSYCVDILGVERKNHADASRRRKSVHLVMMFAFLLCTLAFHSLGSSSVMNLIYTLVGYTYGPLLGLFAFGLFTKKQPQDRAVPCIAGASPLICYLLDSLASSLFGYRFGYELLLFNGLLTLLGLWATTLNYRSRLSCIFSSSAS